MNSPVDALNRADRSRNSRFPRSYRLKRRGLIQPLFDRKESSTLTISSGSIRVLYRVVSEEDVGRNVPLQVGFAVGRSTGNAVVRNRVKRIMREVYRGSQFSLIDLFSKKPEVLTLMVVFRGDANDEEALRADLFQAFHQLTERCQS